MPPNYLLTPSIGIDNIPTVEQLSYFKCLHSRIKPPCPTCALRYISRNPIELELVFIVAKSRSDHGPARLAPPVQIMVRPRILLPANVQLPFHPQADRPPRRTGAGMVSRALAPEHARRIIHGQRSRRSDLIV